ncbi:tetratricopeptide repeat protein [Halalkalibacter akibai]|uniref:TPR repeat protein n=1 Tax=Halalkalibacter akibai (strain ATCC 43226 / DSM 21942 / CIP 109018 / JCM 9157 / 1139) TaxID=1236973 RepID=W4QS63_HALA3|nr:tetratricopeptide repeat protein [Halalkalibacter akibai]GAE34916.1 TPR repeat protein [Halalkalibacter akibai JCM 9157]
MDKRKNAKNENIILYPGLVKRLIEKGMDALKEKDGKSAYQFFLSAEEHEPDNSQILFGKMLSLVELGRLEEAVEHTDSLLRGDIGDYYENLQVHISLLVQLGKYQEVVNILDAVLSEGNFPAHYAESFYQLLHFSRQMVGDTEWNQPFDSLDDPIPSELMTMLESSSLALQSKAIQQLKEITNSEATKALVDFLHKPNQDYVLQSMALHALYEKDCEEVIHIEKQGRKMKVVPKQLGTIYQHDFQDKILDYLSDELEHVDPLLYDIAKQVMTTYMWALYPFIPEPLDEKFWADVFHYCAVIRMGLEDGIERLQESNHDQLELFLEKVEEVKELEALTYQIDTTDFTS